MEKYFNFNPQTDLEKLKVLVMADQPPKNIKLLTDWLGKAENPVLKRYLTEYIAQCNGGDLVSSETFSLAYQEANGLPEGAAMATGGTVGGVADYFNSLELGLLPESAQLFIKEQLLNPPAEFAMDNPTFLEAKELLESLIAKKKAGLKAAEEKAAEEAKKKENAVDTSMLPGKPKPVERTVFIDEELPEKISLNPATLEEAMKNAAIAQKQFKAPIYIFKHIDGGYFFAADKNAGTELVKELPYQTENASQVIQDEIDSLTPAVAYLKGKEKKLVLEKIESLKTALQYMDAPEMKTGGAIENTVEMERIALSKLREYSVKLFNIVNDNLPPWAMAKISKVELIVASVKHELEADHPELFKQGGELGMGQYVKMQLKHISKYSESLSRVLNKVKLHPWMAANLFVAGDYLDSVYHYLDYANNKKMASGGEVESSIQALAAEWANYGGSPLEEFAETGVYDIANHLKYLREVQFQMEPEYHLHPGELTKKEEKELNELKSFFIEEGKKHGIETIWEKHPDYGYLVPFVGPSTPGEIASKIKPIRLMLAKGGTMKAAAHVYKPVASKTMRPAKESGGAVAEGDLYYAIWDNDTQDYLHTGLNSKSKDEVKRDLISYLSLGHSAKELKHMETMTPEELADTYNFSIDFSKEPFAESEFAKGGTFRANQSSALKYANFDGQHFNLVKLNPRKSRGNGLYKSADKYAVSIVTLNEPQKVKNFKTLEAAEKAFDKMVDEKKQTSVLLNEGTTANYNKLFSDLREDMVKQAGNFLSFDNSEQGWEMIEKLMLASVSGKGASLCSNIDGVDVWQPLEETLTVKDFLESLGNEAGASHFAKGGVFEKMKDLGKKAAHTVNVKYGEAKDEVKRRIHAEKKKITLGVLADMGTFASVNPWKEEPILNKAYDLVYDKYAEGGAMIEKCYVFNATDGIYASPEIMDKAAAEKFIVRLRSAFKEQGYYKTATGNRISPDAVEYVLIPVVVEEKVVKNEESGAVYKLVIDHNEVVVYIAPLSKDNTYYEEEFAELYHANYETLPVIVSEDKFGTADVLVALFPNTFKK